MRRMSPFSRVLALVTLAAASGSVLAENALAPHKAEYKVEISVLGGRLNTQLATTDNGYVATHTVRPTGMARILSSGQIKESSEFDRVADGVRPVWFETNDTLTRDKTQASIQFDWATKEASGVVNNQDFQETFEELVFDRVSIQYELMSDLLNNSPSAEYIIFDIDELKTV